MHIAAQPSTLSDEDRAWSCLRALARLAAEGRAPRSPLRLAVDARGNVQHVRQQRGAEAFLQLHPDQPGSFRCPEPLALAARQLLAVGLPLVVGPHAERLVMAHLGQSADGYAATFCGRNKFITGEADIRHTHRMRALFDAVLVGASTVAIDDPLLTTRLVSGASPARVVLDPHARLSPTHQVFRDRSARTLVVTSRGA